MLEVWDEKLKGWWSVVCLYLADFWFVRLSELEELEGEYDKLEELGVKVYCVWRDRELVEKGWDDDWDGISKIQ